MPMAQALRQVAPKARAVRRSLPATYSQWDRAMGEIPTARLRAPDRSAGEPPGRHRRAVEPADDGRRLRAAGRTGDALMMAPTGTRRPIGAPC